MIRLPLSRTATVFALAGVLAGGAVVAAPTPAAASVDFSVGINVGGVSFAYFHRSLSRHGRWIQHPRWGDVWIPPRAHRYRPYFNGYWAYTDVGLLWVSFDPWPLTFHYGRWVWDPFYGWMWIPGYVWAPAWVIFRTGGGFFGWLAMPPDYGYFYDGPYYGGRFGWNDYYGYADWYDLGGDAFFNLWIFVDDRHFYSRDYKQYAFSDSRRVRNIINRTRDTTKYEISGDRMVNRSITERQIERASGQQIRPVQFRSVLKRDVPVVPVSKGRNLARQEGSGQPGPKLHDRNFRPIPSSERRARDAAGETDRGRRAVDREGLERERRAGPDATERGRDRSRAGPRETDEDGAARRGGRPGGPEDRTRAGDPGGQDEDAAMRRGGRPGGPEDRTRAGGPGGQDEDAAMRRGGRPGGADDDAAARRGGRPGGTDNEAATPRGGPTGRDAGAGRRSTGGPDEDAAARGGRPDTESADRPRRTQRGPQAEENEPPNGGEPRKRRESEEGGPDERRPNR
ncbi:MAG: DUF6600 domain-containing protein [Alphaproteobacteria bacterium]